MSSHHFRGKLIVIDGTDGSGKTSQTQLLVERLKDEHYPVRMMDFPQYGKKACGPVEEYLNGRYGTSQEVGPYKASIFYAVDRYDASFEMRRILEKGIHIISNRYVSANMGHQAGKIKNAKKRKAFLKWLYTLEYEIFEIPKPDLNIILHVEPRIAYKLIAQKQPRAYLGGKKRDIHERSITHIRDAERAYLEIGKHFSDFELVECVREQEILTPKVIHEMVWEKVKRIL